MSKAKQIDMLYQTINNQNNTYAWTVGIFITIILTIVGFFAYFQWRLNSNQEQKIINKVRDSLSDEYRFDREERILENVCGVILERYVSEQIGIESHLKPSNDFDLEGDLLTLRSMIDLVYKNANYEFQISNLITVFISILGKVVDKNKMQDQYIQIAANKIDEIMKARWAKDYMEHANYPNIKDVLTEMNRKISNSESASK